MAQHRATTFHSIPQTLRLIDLISLWADSGKYCAYKRPPLKLLMCANSSAYIKTKQGIPDKKKIAQIKLFVVFWKQFLMVLGQDQKQQPKCCAY